MTTAAVPPTESSTRTASILLLGADTVLAARPATPVQLAHACLEAGYTTVIPPSWGDELLATETIRQLKRREPRPVVFCACPHVAERLLGVGDDLAPFLLPLVPPPVAAARYLRHIAGVDTLHITFVGRCPAGSDPSIDAHVSPDAFLASLAGRGIELLEQPLVFDAVLPPDRRRHRSLPGGVPAPEALWNHTGGWPLVEIDGADPLTDFAQYLATGEGTLLDLSPTLHCSCSGAGADVPPRSARAAITSLEPPRSTSDVIDVSVAVQLTRSLPLDRRARRNGAKTSAEASPEPEGGVGRGPAEPGAPPTVADREATSTIAEEETTPAVRRRSPPGGVRAVSSMRGAARSGTGRPLPRAYLARRGASRRSRAGAGVDAAVGAEPGEAIAPTSEPRDPGAAITPDATREAPASKRSTGPESEGTETARGRNGASHPPAADAARTADRPSSQSRVFASVPIAATRPSHRETPSSPGRTPPVTAEPAASHESAATPPPVIDQPTAPSEPEPAATPIGERATESARAPTASPIEPARAPHARGGAGADLMSDVRDAVDHLAGLLDSVLGSVAGVVRDGLGKPGDGPPREGR